MTVLNHQFQTQVTGYYCGPAAVRVALTVAGQYPTQATLAAELGTTVAGTDSSADTARVLNAHLGGGRYQTRYIGGQTPTPVEAAQVWADVITTIDAGRGLVANVAGRVATQDGTSYSYPGGHYVTITGYDLADGTVFVSDVAVREYWTGALDLAGWIATRGYAYATAPPPPPEENDMQTYIIAQGDPGRLYLCDGMVSRPVQEADLPHIRDLAQSGVFALANGGEIRPSWYPGAFGPVPTAGAGGGASADQVADELAQRLQS